MNTTQPKEIVKKIHRTLRRIDQLNYQIQMHNLLKIGHYVHRVEIDTAVRDRLKRTYARLANNLLNHAIEYSYPPVEPSPIKLTVYEPATVDII